MEEPFGFTNAENVAPVVVTVGGAAPGENGAVPPTPIVVPVGGSSRLK